MSNVLNRLHELEISARKAVLLVEHLSAENARLKEENAQLKESLENKVIEPEQGDIEVIEESNTWKDRVVSELDTYIQEIDQCIELLKQ